MRHLLNIKKEERVECPFCNEGRKHKDRKDLRVTPVEGGILYFCHHCGEKGKVWHEEMKERKPVGVKQEKHESFDADCLAFLRDRCISATTALKYSVYTASCFFQQLDRKTKALAFPYFKNGKPYGAKLRSVEDKAFGCTNALATVFGAQLIDLSVANHIIFCEGEFDALALTEAGIANAVSVPNGASSFGANSDSKSGFLWEIREKVEKAERIYICVDKDEPGEKLSEELARRIGKHRVWLITFDEGVKDANEALIRWGREAVKQAFENAQPYPVEGLYDVEHFDDLLTKLYEDGFGDRVSTGFTELDKIYSASPGLLTVITGVPGHGKSTFVDQLMINLAKMDPSYVHAVCSFENPPHVHIAKLAEMVCQKTFLQEDYGQRISVAELNEAKTWISQHFKFLFQDGGRKATVESIMERLKVAIFRWGVKAAVIDPYNYIERPKDAESETGWIDNMLTEFRLFAQASGIHIWFVAHPTKQMKLADGTYQPPKGYDLAGSAAWFSKPDFGLTVYRDDNTQRTRIINWKTRFNWLGQIGEMELYYDLACRVFRADLLDTMTPIGGWDYEAEKRGDRYWDL